MLPIKIILKTIGPFQDKTDNSFLAPRVDGSVLFSVIQLSLSKCIVLDHEMSNDRPFFSHVPTLLPALCQPCLAQADRKRPIDTADSFIGGRVSGLITICLL